MTDLATDTAPIRQSIDFAASDITGVFSEARVSETDTNLIEGLCLCGNASGHGYVIPPSAFGEDVNALYRGSAVFVNHTSERHEESISKRDMTTAAGVVVSAEMKDGKPYGVIDTTDMPHGQLLRAMVRAQREHDLKHIGLSQVALYKFDRNQRKTVDKVHEVFSVDLVFFPATTRTFFESMATKPSQDEEDTMDAAKELNDALREENDRLKESLNTSGSELQLAAENISTLTEALNQAREDLTEIKAESQSIREQLDTYRAAEEAQSRLQSIHDQLKNAGLDPEDEKLCSQVFVESLMGLDVDRRAEVIADRVETLKLATESITTPVQERPNPEGDTDQVDEDYSSCFSGTVSRKSSLLG